MNSLRLVCNCDESAPTSGRERRVTGTRRVYEQEILARDQFALEPGLPTRGPSRLHAPARRHAFISDRRQMGALEAGRPVRYRWLARSRSGVSVRGPAVGIEKDMNRSPRSVPDPFNIVWAMAVAVPVYYRGHGRR